MTAEVIRCSPLDDLSDALEIMSIKRVRRLPVCTNSGELVGIITIADAASVPSRKEEAADALAEICSSAEVPCQVPMFC
jgi:CBS domain-containing protein